MTFLSLQPLSVAQLPAAVALDQRCLGGLWTLDGYQRELESPNSELLVLVKEAEGVGGAGGAGGARGAEGVGGAGGAEERESLRTERTRLPSSMQGEKTAPFLPPTALASPASSAFPASPSPILGLGCYWAILEEAHITMLAIEPIYHRQGLGQALLSALLASAHARGLERATLEVRASNAAALSLYQRFDFREAGRRRRYYPDDGEDALVLWRGGLQAPDFPERLTNWQQQAWDRLHRSGWQFDQESDRQIINQ